MSRPLAILVGIACVAVIAFVGYFFWDEYRRAAVAHADEAALRCSTAEYELAEAKAGRPVPNAGSENVLRLVVWGCRGRPDHRLPSEL